MFATPAGFLVVVGAPWQISVLAAVLVAAYGLLRQNLKGPATREEVAEQERNARSPNLLPVANMGVALSGAFLFTSFLAFFVMFMNAVAKYGILALLLTGLMLLGFLRLRSFSLGPG